VERAGLKSPCLTIVGEVVRLREELDWFRGQTGSEFVCKDSVPVQA
jgi:hypothetical protein